MLKRGENLRKFQVCRDKTIASISPKVGMQLRIIKLHNFVANLSVWVV